MPKTTKPAIWPKEKAKRDREYVASVLSRAEQPVSKTMSYDERIKILFARHFKEFLELQEEFKKKKALARRKA